jgi:hypothetical protein
MFTEIVSNIYSLVSCLEIVSNIYSLVSCLQRLCQISIAWCHVYRDCVKYLQLGVMFTEIASNIIALCHVNSIFASQGLQSTHLLSTLGRLSQKFVIPVYRPLADFWSSVHVHYIIINQWERLYYYLFEGTSVNWANTLNVSVNIVLLCLGDKDSWQSLQFSPHVAIVYIFLSLHVIVAWSFVRHILIGRSHPLLHRIENNTVRTRNSDLICQGWRGEDRNPWLAKMCLQRLCQIFSFRGVEILKSSTCPRASNLKKVICPVFCVKTFDTCKHSS